MDLMPIATRLSTAPVIYGWDASHYDGTLTTGILIKAEAEGIAFFSHKLGEGTGNVDNTAVTALAAARDAGIQVIGGYWFCHNADDPVAEADRMVARADADESWWRDFPGWFWQADCETETGNGKPSKTWIKAFCDRLVATTGRTAIVYASHGEYGDSLTGVGHPLWNANYPSSRAGAPASIYPGNSYAGWTAYSGQTPVIAQFSSSATIAGKTTCDANAFRGTVDDLLTLIGAEMPLSADDLTAVNKAVWQTDQSGPNYPWMSDFAKNAQIKGWSAVQDAGNEAHSANLNAAAALAGVAGVAKQLTALTALVQAGGGSTETAAILKAIGDAESATVAAQAAQITALTAKLAAAEQAAAATLTAK